MPASAPQGGIERTRLQQWLCFIGTELHKSLFTPLLGKTSAGGGEGLHAARNISRGSNISTTS